jgi:PadR family transcriptional regulator AphA
MARASKSRFAVLGMLTMGPMTGYRLREAIAESIGHFWNESFGQLYPTLHALAAEGLVESKRLDREGRSRLEYRLTDAGWEALRDWLATDAESLASSRSELLLQLFFGRHTEAAVLRRHLERHRAVLLETRMRYVAIEAAVLDERSPDRPYWLATVRHGLTLTEAGLAWVDQTTTDLGLVRSSGKGLTDD